MSIKIGTGRYTAEIHEQGAELASIFDTREGTEYIWSGDPSWWSGTAPVLFPNIGGFRGGFYRYKGKIYTIGSHGFARNSAFNMILQSPDHASFELISNERLKEVYPFSFQLIVSFFMDYSGITVSYTVRNIGSPWMYFSIGSHPAFRLPFDGGILEHYYIEFEGREEAQRYFFVDGCISEDQEPVLSNSRQIFLTRSLFDRGPLIFKDIQSTAISIRKSRSERQIIVEFDTPYLAVWSKPKGAPFLCIEPWNGIPDPVNFSGSIEEKPGIIRLGYNETFFTKYRIEIR